jgi:peptidyl-prolyl cis-trans isomerase SurA
MTTQKMHSSFYLLICQTFLKSYMLRNVLLATASLFIACQPAFCQSPEKINLDKIILVVGDHVSLQSELNQTIMEYKMQDPNVSDTIACTVLDGILTKYLLCEQAARDSVTISDEEVEANLDNRIRYMEQQYGSPEQMEATIGKTVFQLKEEYRPFFKSIMLSQRMQGQLQNNVKVSPAEVRTFFDKIPKDSLPSYPSMVEVGQIVLSPVASVEAQEYAKQQLIDIRKQIIDGKADFETMAGIYSKDPGSKDKGGDLGDVTRDAMVPEFSAAGFRLQNGEISEPVKTTFGYHIIQMVQRKGEKAHLRHILIAPLVTSPDIAVCQARLDSIRTLVTSGKMTFMEAVKTFSTDDATKNSGGMVVNPQTGSSLLTIEELGGELAIAVGNLKVNDYSAVNVYDAIEGNPVSSNTPNENKRCRFVYLKRNTEPHVANLEQDFNRIQQVALENKRSKYIFDWVDSKIGDFYIYVDPAFSNCAGIKKWMTTKEKE